jgi:hypothetical protein
MAKDLRKHCFEGVMAAAVKPVTETEMKSGEFDRHSQTVLGLRELLIEWVRIQRELDCELDQDVLTEEERSFLPKDTSNFGCLMPPSAESMPTLPDNFSKAYDLDDSQRDEITSCLQILRSAYFPWARQSSSTPQQHLKKVAIDIFQLHQDKLQIFQNYLGENQIWKLYSNILALVLKIAPHFVAWHGVVPQDRQENEHQMMLTTTHQSEDIGPLFGAGMASKTTQINDRYQSGINKIISTVHSTAKFEHDGKEYISRDVNLKLVALLRVSIVNIEQFAGY